ncbi:hypothetical protein H671_2g5008 [Cricetulus griseus]|nr:hypothetical protein H671_2g5008 [Cricetulus griseus]
MRGSCHNCCRGSRAAQPTLRPAYLHPVRRPGSECAGFRRGGGAATPLSRRGRRPRPDAPLAPWPRLTKAQDSQRPPDPVLVVNEKASGMLSSRLSGRKLLHCHPQKRCSHVILYVNKSDSVDLNKGELMDPRLISGKPT